MAPRSAASSVPGTSIQPVRLGAGVLVHGPPGGEAAIHRVPELNPSFTPLPAQQDVLAVAPSQEVDEADLQVLHLPAQRPNLFQPVGQGIEITTEHRLGL